MMAEEKIQDLLRMAPDVDAFLLSSRVARYYYTGCNIAEGYVLLCGAQRCYLTDSRYLEDARRQLPDFTFFEIGHAASALDLLQQAVQRFKIKTLGFEEARTTVAEYCALEQRLQVKMVPCQGLLDRPRQCKSAWELEKMRRAQEITDAAFSDLLQKIHPGLREKELMGMLIGCLYAHGADGLSFDPIVVSGPNTSMPHGVAGERILQNGDFVTMDFGCLYAGYCSDMTRTVALGYATEPMQAVYETVLQAQCRAISQSRAGMPGCDIDRIARDVIEQAGYGEFFGHSYGHGLGLEVHEAPNCSPRSAAPIPVGAVCSAEPGIYLPGKFGVRIEDVVVFTEEGTVNLTKSPKALQIIS